MSLFRSMKRPTTAYHSTSYPRIAQHHGFEGHGKTILVTGGAGGLGYHIARAFAAAGVARLAILSRSRDSQDQAKARLELEFPSTEVMLFQASVTDSRRVQAVFAELGTVDVLVSSAAAIHRRARATDLTADEIQDSFDTNVIATFNITRAYMDLPAPASGVKTVINVSSAALQVSNTLRVGYGSSKAAAACILQHFASEHSRDEVKILSFHPGFFFTPAMARMGFTKENSAWDEVDLPAHFALWLAGPESDFLNRRHVWANWDVDEMIALKEKLEGDRDFLTIGLRQ